MNWPLFSKREFVYISTPFWQQQHKTTKVYHIPLLKIQVKIQERFAYYMQRTTANTCILYTYVTIDLVIKLYPVSSNLLNFSNCGCLDFSCHPTPVQKFVNRWKKPHRIGSPTLHLCSEQLFRD